MSAALDFLAGDRADQSGRTLDDYLAFSREDWERQHDVIQWAFPTRTVSAYNPDAPILPDGDIGYSPVHQQNILKLFKSYLESLNLKMSDADNGTNLIKFEFIQSQLYGHWMRRGDHNYKRLSRVIECLGLFGLEPFRDDLAEYLIFDYAINYNDRVDSVTVVYWMASWQNKKHLLPVR